MVNDQLNDQDVNSRIQADLESSQRRPVSDIDDVLKDLLVADLTTLTDEQVLAMAETLAAKGSGLTLTEAKKLEALLIICEQRQLPLP